MPIFKNRKETKAIYRGDVFVEKAYQGASLAYVTPDGLDTTLTGNPLVLEKCLRADKLDLEIHGWTKQKQFHGYNLMDINNYRASTSYVDITVDGDTVISDPGDSAANYYGPIYNIAVSPNTTYYFRIENFFSDASDNAPHVAISEKNKAGEEIVTNTVIYNLSNKNSFVGFTTNEETESLTLSFRSRIAKRICTFVRPMLTTTANAVYEPYVGGIPSPNFQYPQEITSASNIQLKQWGNLVCESDFTYGGFIDSAGTMQQTYRTDLLTTGYVRIPSGVLQLFVGDMELNAMETPAMCFYDKDKKYLIGENYGNASSKIFDVPKNAVYFRTSKRTIYPKFVVQCGAAYKGKICEIDNIELTKWDKIEKRDGIWGVSKCSGKHILDGTNIDTYSGGLYTSRFSELVNETEKVVYNDISDQAFCSHMVEKRYFGVNEFTNGINKFAFHFNFMNLTCEEANAEAKRLFDAGKPIYFIYPTTDEVSFIPFSEVVQSQLNALQTYIPTTSITNDADCDMTVRYKSLISYSKVYGDSPTFMQEAPAAVQGKAMLNMIGGKSVVWNQVFNLKGSTFPKEFSVYGVKVSIDSSRIHLSGVANKTDTHVQIYRTADTEHLCIGHTMFFYVGDSDISGYYIMFDEERTHYKQYHNNTIGVNIYGSLFQYRVTLKEGVSYDNDITPMVFDLTNIFGVGNEPNDVTDSRITWLVEYAKTHPEYNIGSIVHADCQRVVSNGRNLFDEIFVQGTYDATGALTPTSTQYVSSKNKTPIKPNTNYTISCSQPTQIWVVEFSGDEIVSRKMITYSGTASTFLSQDGTNMLHLMFGGSNAPIRIDDGINVQLEEGTTATPYTPYRTPTVYQLPYAEQDSWGIGDVYNERNFQSGKRMQRIGCKKITGGLGNTSLQEEGFINGTTILYDRQPLSTVKLINSYGLPFITYGMGKECIYIGGNANKFLYIKLSSSKASTLDELNSYLKANPLYVYYELLEPIETEMPYTPPRISVEEGGTICFENSVMLTVPNEVEYAVPLDQMEAQITTIYNSDVKELSNL